MLDLNETIAHLAGAEQYNGFLLILWIYGYQSAHT